MVYGDYILTVDDGVWFVFERSVLIASGSKAYVFSVIDR